MVALIKENTITVLTIFPKCINVVIWNYDLHICWQSVWCRVLPLQYWVVQNPRRVAACSVVMPAPCTPTDAWECDLKHLKICLNINKYLCCCVYLHSMFAKQETEMCAQLTESIRGLISLDVVAQTCLFQTMDHLIWVPGNWSKFIYQNRCWQQSKYLIMPRLQTFPYIFRHIFSSDFYARFA